MKIKVILIVVLLIQQVALAQQNPISYFTVKGTAIDSAEKKAMPFATVSITDVVENKVVTVLATSGNGSFEARLKQAGKYEISISNVGFGAFRKSFEISESNAILDLGSCELIENDAKLGEVVIVASKSLVEVESDKLTYNADIDPEVKTATTLDLLRKVPLVSVDGDDNVTVKGSGSFKIFINGKPSSMASSNSKDFLRNFPASTIKSIEIITSPGAKYDAEGIGGIINIVTNKKVVNGYTGSVGASANTGGWYNTNAYLAVSFGKFVFSGNGSLGYNMRPASKSYLERTNFDFPAMQHSFTNSTSEYTGQNGWGSFEMSYDIDTLNLISASMNFWGSQGERNSVSDDKSYDENNVLSQAYSTIGFGTNRYANPNGNIDFQHLAKRNKEEMLTLSYKFDLNPSKSDFNNRISNELNFIDYDSKNFQNMSSSEHTFQTDYVYPMDKMGNLEIGAKYILRLNTSEYDVYIFDDEKNDYIFDLLKSNAFNYTQNIAAGYISYQLNYKKIGFKAGIRTERAYTNGEFTRNDLSNFKNESFEWVPSASVSYAISPMKSLQMAYTKRIQRPDIWYLNPYVNDRNPKEISFGNPGLDAERFHRFSANYNTFGSFGSINGGLDYSFSNNGIDDVTTRLRGDTMQTTYFNINKSETIGANLNLNLKITKELMFSLNGSVNYNMFTNRNDASQSNDGWGSQTYGNINYRNSEKNWRVSAYLGYYKWAPGLQSVNYGQYHYGVSAGKEFFNKKLNVSVSANAFFEKNRKWQMKTFNDSFEQTSTSYFPGRSFGINISYKFGEMSDMVKKTNRSIDNDDKKSGGNNSE